MKDIELKLLCELMKNSRRSDRQLAKAIGASQPTISRIIRKLEKKGYIKEYTIIPDFKKLGFQMMTVVLAKLKEEIGNDYIENVRKKVREDLKQDPVPNLMAMTGEGCDADRVTLLLSRDYAAYSNYMRMFKQHPLVEVNEIRAFKIDLDDESQFLPLTLSNLAKFLEKELTDKKSHE